MLLIRGSGSAIGDAGAVLAGPSLRPGSAKRKTLSGATGSRQPVSLHEALAGGGSASYRCERATTGMRARS